jgi:hypothetical protein
MVSTYHPENVGRKKEAIEATLSDKHNTVGNTDGRRVRSGNTVSPRVAAITASRPVSAEPISAIMRK